MTVRGFVMTVRQPVCIDHPCNPSIKNHHNRSTTPSHSPRQQPVTNHQSVNPAPNIPSRPSVSSFTNTDSTQFPAVVEPVSQSTHSVRSSVPSNTTTTTTIRNSHPVGQSLHQLTTSYKSVTPVRHTTSHSHTRNSHVSQSLKSVNQSLHHNQSS